MKSELRWSRANARRFVLLGTAYVSERAALLAALLVPTLLGATSADLGRLEFVLTAGTVAAAIGPLGTENAIMHKRYVDSRGNWRIAVLLGLAGGGVVGIAAATPAGSQWMWLGGLLGASLAVMHVARNRLRVLAGGRPLAVSTGLLVMTYVGVLVAGAFGVFSLVAAVPVGLAGAAILASLPAFWWVASKGSPGSGDARGMLAFGLPLAVAAMFTSVTAAADRYLVDAFYGVEAVGTYGVMYRTVMLLSGVASIGVYWWQTEALRRGSEWARTALGAYLRIASFTMSGIVLLAWWPLATFLSHVLGVDFGSSAAVTGWLLFSILGFVVQAGFVNVFMAAGATRNVTLVRGTAAATNVALNLLFIPLLGLPGAALAMALSQWIGAGLGGLIHRRVGSHGAPGAT